MKNNCFILLLLILFSSCSEVLTSTALTNSNWQLTEWPGQTLPEKAVATLNFKSDNSINGKAFCNSYGGKYTVGNANKLTFGNTFSTKMYCEEVAMAETKFLEALSLTDGAKIINGKLHLMQGETTLLIFSKLQ